jgi:hypothetical protein
MSENKEEKKEKKILTSGMFGDKIVLEHDDPVKHDSKVLPNGHLCFTIIGCSGCGKSHVLLSLIPQIANLSQIVICSLITKNKVYDAIEEYCEQKGIQFTILHDPKSAYDAIESMILEKEEGTDGLCIFDDFSHQNLSKNDPYNQCADSVGAMMRNYGYHSAYITQSPTNVPTLFRNNANVKIVFQLNDTHAIRSIRNDYINSGILKTKEEFDELFQMVLDVEHAFLMLVSKGSFKKLFISLPKPGVKDEIKEVEICRTSNVKDDEYLKKRIEDFKGYPFGINATSYDKHMKNRLKKDIRDYTVYLARKYKTVPSEILEEIEKHFDIDMG